MKNAFAVLVLIFLIFFGAYSVAPVFGLDELWPKLFGYRNQLVGAMLVVLMVVGGLYWRGFWIVSNRRRRSSSDD